MSAVDAGDRSATGPAREEDLEAPWAAALSGLPGMGPAGLVSLLAQWSPREAWERVVAGEIERPSTVRSLPGRRPPAGLVPPGSELVSPGSELVPPGSALVPPTFERARQRSWVDIARGVDPPKWWWPKAAAGIRVTWTGAPNFPAALDADPHPPGVLFWRGSIGVLDRPCVAIVGTRSATPDGRAVAFEMGRDLAAAGVCVVSGLALGIDGAAHTGALTSLGESGFAGPAGVAASGVDVPYPRRHAKLWERVVAAGVVLSETLPGHPAQAWRFPSRNRVIAGLVSMVVVVESHPAGGSLITAEAAIERGVEVRVVPGPVHSPASAGSNQLLYDGPGPVRDARDVLDAIGMLMPDRRRPGDGPSAGRALAGGHSSGLPPALGARAEIVLAAIGWRPASLSEIVDRCGMGVAETAEAMDDLESRGLVEEAEGWWSRTAKGAP